MIYSRVDDGKGSLRAPRAKEVCKRYNLKHTRYLHRWQQEKETLLLVKPLQKRHRPSRGHWPKLEKSLVQAFADRCKEGKTVRKKWFERMAKALFLQLYPDSPTIFIVSNGWFNRFLSRSEISIRIVTNKAQQTPTEYCAIIFSLFQSAELSTARWYGRYGITIYNCSWLLPPFEYSQHGPDTASLGVSGREDL